MNTQTREIKESPLVQGANERIAYHCDTSAWGGSASTPPSSPSVTILDEDGTDVTATYTTGSASITDTINVTTPIIHSLVDKENYKLLIEFVIDSNTLEAFATLYGQA